MIYKQTFTKFLALLLFVFTFASSSYAQLPAYEISKWKDWKTSATVLTFDDMSAGHPSRAVPELNERGLPASFYVNGWSFDLFQSEIEDMVADGHEIGNHSASHAELLQMGASDITFQITDFKDEIDEKLPTQECLTVAYPFGDGGGATSKDQQIRNITKQRHIGARRVANSTLPYDFAFEDYFRVPAFLIRGNTGTVQFNEWFFTGITEDHLRVFIFHGIGSDDNGFEPITLQAFNFFLNQIANNLDKTWVGTFKDVIKYHREASTASLSIIGPRRPTYVILRLSDVVRGADGNATFNLPIDLRVEDTLGFDVKYIVDENGELIPFEKRDGFIYFSKIPNEQNFYMSSEPINGYQAPQTIDFPPIADKDLREEPFVPMATTSSGLPATFSVVSGPATSDGTTITLNGTGSVLLQADQPGSEQYLAAAPVQQTLQVIRRKDQIISFDTIPRKLTIDPPFQIVANSNSGLPVTVEVVSGPATIDSATNRTVTLTGAGTVVLRALQAGNEEFWRADSVTRTFEVLAKQPQTITFGTLPDIIASSDPFMLEATASSGLAIVYAVDSGPATVNGNMLSLTGEVGKVVVRASQPGSEAFLAAEDVVVSFRAFKLDQTIAFDSIENKFTTSRPFKPVASSSSDLPVTFNIISGDASFVGDSLVVEPKASTVIVEALQEGDESYNSAVPIQRSFQVLRTPQLVTLDSIGDFYVNAQPFRVKASASSGLSILFKIVSGPAFITDGNQVSLTGFAGDVVIEASQSGDEVWAPGKDDQLFEVVELPPTSVKEFTDRLTGLRLYPNPASSKVNIAFETRSSESIQLGIYNMHGQGVYLNKTTSPGKNIIPVDVSEFASGIYYLKINASQLLGSGTFMVK